MRDERDKPEQKATNLPATTILLTNKTAQLLQHQGVKLGDEVDIRNEDLKQYLGSFTSLKMEDLKTWNSKLHNSPN